MAKAKLKTKDEETALLFDCALREAKELSITLDTIRTRRDRGLQPTADKLEELRHAVEDLAMHEGLADS